MRAPDPMTTERKASDFVHHLNLNGRPASSIGMRAITNMICKNTVVLLQHESVHWWSGILVTAGSQVFILSPNRLPTLEAYRLVHVSASGRSGQVTEALGPGHPLDVKDPSAAFVLLKVSGLEGLMTKDLDQLALPTNPCARQTVALLCQYSNDNVISPGTILTVSSRSMVYNAETSMGWGGAPVLGEDGGVLAIHCTGSPDKEHLPFQVNAGVRIDTVMESLQEVVAQIRKSSEHVVSSEVVTASVVGQS